MSRYRILIIVISCFFLSLLVLFILSINRQLDFGFYNSAPDLSQFPSVSQELHYFSWDEEPEIINRILQSSITENLMPIVTLEPWPKNRDRQLLDSINQGKYDDTISQVCTVLSTLNYELVIRWGHEMDLLNSRYPWAGKDADLFIDAYQYFVKKCRMVDVNNNFIFMWSPSGDNLAAEYWPGRQYVDIIGVSVYSFDLWDQEEFGHQRSFLQIFYPKYRNLAGLGRPIMIAEMGVTGTTEFQEQWLKKAFFQMKFFPKLIGAIYFNSLDNVGVWGKDLPIPDWRLK